MPKYFMSGTKYADYERIMMDQRRQVVGRLARDREKKGIPPAKKFHELVVATERSE